MIKVILGIILAPIVMLAVIKMVRHPGGKRRRRRRW